ncbi:MAG TPA: LLM class flavin-dependent oxidoreductase [Streptosporangiaceae bacterium]|nr:LLM class flavin-dependent oxidoreductase [Streptosporangiaceae bacterium]
MTQPLMTRRHEPKRIHLNLFEMNCVSHITHGMWVHPDNTRHRFNELAFWLELAQLLEHGTFDAMFLADVTGTYDTFRDGHETAVTEGMQIPSNDPLMVILAMAAVTARLGFAATFSTTYEPPFSFARRMSTLDHLTAGRVGWNVVTSYLPNAARNFGYSNEIEHDNRYERADEYLDVVYKLWEGSWEDDAVLADRQRRIYADPSKVHYINHAGRYYRVSGPHLCEPSPQRTPVIFQAGVSGAGRQFAGKHAEAIFIGGRSIDEVKFFIDDIRRIARAEGRDGADIKFFPGVNIIVGRDADEVAVKVRDYQRLRSVDGYLAHNRSRIDWTRYNRAERVGAIAERGDPGSAGILDQYPPDRTVGEILDSLGALSRPFSVAGTPDVVADRLGEWVDHAGVDGFNLIQHLTPGTARDVIELVIPELRRRGRYRNSYDDDGAGTTLRERLFGPGQARLKPTHPGARYRHLTHHLGA